MLSYFKSIITLDISYEFQDKLFKKFSLILFFLLAIFLSQEVLVHFYETYVTGRPHNHKLGDWAINYNDGFVRRGLVGQILLYLDWYLYIPMLNSLFFFTVIIVILFYYFLYKIFINLKNKSLFWFFIFLSPSFLLFTFYDFEGGFRKENLGFLSFSILIFAFIKKDNKKYIFSSIILFFFSTFSHEMHSFFIPFFLCCSYYLYKLNKIGFNFFLISVLMYLLIAISSIIVSFIYSGFGHSAGICETVTNTGIHNNICGGSIIVLEKNIYYYISKTLLHFPQYPIHYTPLLFLAITPIFLIKNSKKYLPFIFFSFISILPLFIIAADWGRWISIYITYTYMLLMMINLNYKLSIRKINVFISLIFISSWHIPVYNINENTIILLSNIYYILNPVTFINNPGEYINVINIIIHGF